MAEAAGVFWNPRHGRGGHESAHGDGLYGALRDWLDPGAETASGYSSLDDVEGDDRYDLRWPLCAGGGVLAVSSGRRSFSDGTAHCMGRISRPYSNCVRRGN